MTDYGALWRRSQVKNGERALALRQAGYRWGEISDLLHLGGIDDARRAAALYLAADLATRQAAGDGAGRATGAPAARYGREPG